MKRREFARLTALAPLLGPKLNSILNSELNLDQTAPNKPLVALPETARSYDIGHGLASILVDASRSGGKWWLGSFVSEAGRKTSLHRHFHAAEEFFVLEGVLSVWLDDRWQDLPARAVAAVPARVPHALGNRSSQPVKFLTAGQPAGFEGFFADIEMIARRLPYDSPEFLAELKLLYPKYDSELLGPPPPG